MGGTLRSPKITLVVLLIAMIATMGISAENAADKAQPSRLAESKTAPGLRTLVSISAEDAYLPTVLSILAAKSGFNIVTGPGVSKEERISIHLKDTPIEEAMNLVVRAAGLSYDLVGNSFLVAKADQLRAQVGLNSYVLELQYANAEDVQKLLEDVQASIQIDKSGNKLLIITTPKIITDIERVVSEIDRPALQITLSARLIEVSVEDEERLGINWAKLSSSTKLFVYEGASMPGAETASGIDALSDRARQYNVFQGFNDFNDFGNYYRSQPVYEIALDWLLKNSRAEVLTNTSVATMNAKTAYIQMIDIVPYVTSAGGVGGQISVQREEVGIKLAITPQVNSDGYITVEVQPEVSSIFEFIGPDMTVPRVVKRVSSMTVRVQNGQSIIVGGLMGITASKTSHKFPFFGDLPYLGSLFRYNAVSTKKTDLVIEITPYIIEDEYTYIRKSKAVEESFERYKEDFNLHEDQEVEEE